MCSAARVNPAHRSVLTNASFYLGWPRAPRLLQVHSGATFPVRFIVDVRGRRPVEVRPLKSRSLVSPDTNLVYANPGQFGLRPDPPTASGDGLAPSDPGRPETPEKSPAFSGVSGHGN